ncbi:MAG: glycosyl hydrolase family 28 protein [Candidatus Azobacteroides sp.]|nr:glycosyl hydrolase family 28 protein [Candidatus Azobacteroides sp.]
MLTKVTLAILLLCATSIQAQKDYKASMFGIRSDGETLNTGSIQKAIDYISENGGGRLVFYVGRYLTGTVYLKSNVTIQLEEGAALKASTVPYDYNIGNSPALVVATGQENVSIAGKGLIEGQGALLNVNIDEQGARGNLPSGLKTFRPALIYLENCTNVTISDILLFNAAGDTHIFTNCRKVRVTNVTVQSKVEPLSKGFVLTGCSDFQVVDSFIDVSSAPLFLKGTASKGIQIKNSITADGKKIQAKQ